MGFNFVPLSGVFSKTHSDDYNLIVSSVNRAVLPKKEKRAVKVALRDEPVDFGDNAYSMRSITLRAALCCETLEDKRKALRKIAYWLSEKGQLSFDDEPNLYYVAELFTPLSQEEFAENSEFMLEFECEPFAYGERVIKSGKLGSGTANDLKIEYAGTRKTPFILTIINTGDIISGLEISKGS